jgi:hypothetical protein
LYEKKQGPFHFHDEIFVTSLCDAFAIINLSLFFCRKEIRLCQFSTATAMGHLLKPLSAVAVHERAITLRRRSHLAIPSTRLV